MGKVRGLNSDRDGHKRLRGGEMLAIVRERRKENAKGGGTASCAPVSISGVLEACIDGIADVSGKWEGEIRGRGQSSCSVYL
jgi:hypothetical protein